MKRTYTAQEITEALGKTTRAVQFQATKGLWPFLEQPNPKGGGVIKLYTYASLPVDVRRAVETWEMKRLVEERKALVATEPRNHFADMRKMVGGLPATQTPAAPPAELLEARPLAALTPRQERKALAEADLLRLYLEAAGLAKRGAVLQIKISFLAAYNRGAAGPYPQLFEVLGLVTFKTIERWAVKAKKVQQKGGDLVRALAPRHGDHLRGLRRIGGREGKLEDLMRTPQGKILLAWALSPNRYNKAQVIFNARSAMRQRGIQDNESDATYKRFLDDFEARKNHIWIYSREGKQAWNDQCAFYIERDYDLLEVGDCLVADGHILDFESINPYTGKPKRMTLITFYDMKSNFPCGWEIMPTENTQAIAAALWRAILALGKLPTCVYLDNGRAFGSKYFTGDLKQSGLDGLFKRLGIQTIFAWPYHGQSKTVERWHLILKEFEKHAPTYVGGSIDEKPPRLNRGEREHRKMWERLTRGAVPSLLQTHRGLAAWLDEKYNPRPQPRGHLKGKSPLEVFMAGKGPGIDPNELHFLMLSQTVRTIHRRGITHRGKDYYAPELYGRRHPVMIRYDLIDSNYILVYEEDGTLLCKAEVMTKVHPIARTTGTEAHQEELKRQTELKKHQEKEASSFCRMLSETLVQPETEAHFARLGLSPEGAPTPKKLPRPAPLSEGEKEQIAADAAAASRKMQTEKDRLEEMKFRPDSQRYLELLQYKVQGGQLKSDDNLFVFYFRKGEEYSALKDWFEAKDLEMVCQARKKATESSHENIY